MCKMPIATRAKVQGQIPFQCRKTRSNSLSTKESNTMKSTMQTKSKKSGTSKKKAVEASRTTNKSTRESRMKARALTKQMASPDVSAVGSASGEWQVSPRKRQLARGNN